MLSALRGLFSSPVEEIAADDGKVTLADVLRRDWLELWYQPQIELKSRRLAGAEALARARHPTRGIIPPGEFLAGASEADMLALTERVIIAGLRDWEAFASNGIFLKLSVNTPVSALVTLPLTQLLREERPKAENWPGLTLEVTEDEIVNDLALANDVADRLREFNCTLALDDFGAGYSSLARLRELPFSELKIDRSYVANCNSDRVNGGLCEVIVELAQRFGLTSVAEGIETMYEKHKLEGLGCNLGQGYLFAKPMPRERLIAMIRPRLGLPLAAPARQTLLRRLIGGV
jgi:EAL domain-containing protein (putative c-di-GMP-specific phosphodiesterase class I)